MAYLLQLACAWVFIWELEMQIKPMYLLGLQSGLEVSINTTKETHAKDINFLYQIHCWLLV